MPTTTSDTPKESGLKLSFKAIFEFIGKTLAITLSFKEWELKEPESELLATQSDEVILEFAPTIENKWAKLGVLLISVLTIFGKRYFDFEKDKLSKSKKENTEENKKIVEVKNVI